MIIRSKKKSSKILKVFTAFSGYDSQCMALDRLGIDYELVGWSEIDQPAIASHNALYPQYANRNYGDISKIDWDSVPNIDLFTYSFPCVDYSICGKQLGGEEGSGTKSSLLWECLKAIKIKKPKYLLLENVKHLTSKKFMSQFIKWVRTLDKLGYVSTWQVICAGNYGIPQNRERVFLISIRQDNAQTALYYFPERIELDTTVSDFFEKEVDEKYYFSNDVTKKFLETINGYSMKVSCPNKKERLIKQIATPLTKNNLAPTIMASSYEGINSQNMSTTAYFPKLGVLEVYNKRNKYGIKNNE